MNLLHFSKNFSLFCCGRSILVVKVSNKRKMFFKLSDIEERCNQQDSFNDNYFTCLALSNNEELLCAGCSAKIMCIWNMSLGIILYAIHVAKRPMALQFSLDMLTFLVADKTGDVYAYSVKDGSPVLPYERSRITSSSAGSLQKYHDNDDGGGSGWSTVLLGHLSTLLDMKISTCGKFLLTCDRDEKIRVSSFPNAYSIYSYCLGHTEFVTQLVLHPTRQDCIFSGSGDGSVRLWNFITGECLSAVYPLESDQPQKNNTGFCATHPGKEKDPESNRQKQLGKSRTPVVCLAACMDSLKRCLVAVALDGCAEIFICNLCCNELRFLVKCKTLPVPLALEWMHSEEDLLLVLDSSDVPIKIISLKHDSCFLLKKHWLISLGQEEKTTLYGALNSRLNYEVLFKQKVDNMPAYIKMKQERELKGSGNNEDFPSKKAKT